MTSLTIDAGDDRLEGMYGWLEQHPGSPVEFWGLEDGRRFALLAYGDGGDDAFGWSNWATKAAEDPSELVGLFDQVEIVVAEEVATALQAAFPGIHRAV
ncbi:MAG TPA: hypothetical protein VHZ26_17930 [Caulobacteraceae bacterium]|jgi:hypothetical protein|nr:hypothetical protein [Caulobacteraceae bacterium]